MNLKTQKDMETKKCRICGEEKPLMEFHRNKKANDGLRNECKECVRKQHKQYYDELKDAASKNGIDKYTARELMEELARRGYRGKLEYTQTNIIDITSI